MKPRRSILALAALAALGAGTRPAAASSHREAPGIMNYPAGDNTDVYFFVSPTNPDAVTIVGCWWPMEEPAGGPNYFHFADDLEYNFHVDNDGDARADLTYSFRFRSQVQNPATFLYSTGPISSLNDPDWNYRQSYQVLRFGEHGAPAVLADDLTVPPVNVGPQMTPDYDALAAEAVATIPDGAGRTMQVFAGQRDDPFYVDLGAIFDLLAFRAIPGNLGSGVDGVGGYNCQAIVFEVPIASLTRDGSNPIDPASPAAVLGLWSTTRRGPLTPASKPTQISRLGMPLVNEVVVPLAKKDVWNGSYPAGDAQFLSYVTDPELAQLVEGIYGIAAPPAPRCDLVAIFLTGIPGLNQPAGVVPSEQMRLNVAIKPDDVEDSRFGLLGGDLDGFPNGRRLADDVVDIAERAMEGVVYPLLCNQDFEPNPLAGQLGDGIDANDRPFLAEFPYLASPWQGWEHDHHRVEPPHPPERTEIAGAGANPLEKLRTRIANDEVKQGAKLELGRVSPNPLSSETRVSFRLAEPADLQLRVYNVSGREVRSLLSGRVEAGAHDIVWDGMDAQGQKVSAGVYLIHLAGSGNESERKVTVIR